MSKPLPSFIDLRALADDTASLPGPASRSGDPYLDERRVLELDDGPVTTGIISLPSGRGSVPSLSADEFVFALEGEVSFSADGQELVLSRDQSAVLPSGSGFSWSADAPARLIFLRYETPDKGGIEAPVLIDESAPLEPSGAPLAELLVGPTPSCRNHTDFTSADGEFMCGTWDSTPYHRRAMHYRHHELMHLLEGSVTFEDDQGLVGTFERGDVFLVRRGSNCSWESRVNVSKVFAIYRPAP